MTSASSLPDEAFNSRPLRSLARIVVWPAVLLGIVAAMVWGDQQEQRDPVRGLLTLGLIPAVMLLERWITLDVGQLFQRDRHGLHDLGHMLANTFAGTVFGLALLSIPWLLAEPLAQRLGGSPWPASWPWAAQCLLALVIADFLGYWVHRFEHTSPVLWAYHVVHHDLERLHILRGTREHFVTTFVRGGLIS